MAGFQHPSVRLWAGAWAAIWTGGLAVTYGIHAPLAAAGQGIAPWPLPTTVLRPALTLLALCAVFTAFAGWELRSWHPRGSAQVHLTGGRTLRGAAVTSLLLALLSLPLQQPVAYHGHTLQLRLYGVVLSALLALALALLALWIVGGVMALSGALSYAELSAALPRSGGEYHYLSRIYHPLAGLLGGWISVAVGFAAPIALAAIALGRYGAPLLGIPAPVIAAAAVLLVTGVHVRGVQGAKDFQVGSTAVKFGLIVLFIGVSFVLGRPTDLSFAPEPGAWRDILSPAFATSLIFVSYAFTGWNAATYLAGEVENPQRTLPRTLLHGTLLVTVLYTALNLVFLRSVPLESLAGKVEVGAIAAEVIFGASGGRAMSAMLCLILVSTISAMVLAGPRVVQVIGEDIPALRFFARTTADGSPRNAILLQQGFALAFILTGSFEAVLSYAGILLTLSTLLTVAGVYVLRQREPGLARPYRTWGYPVTPALYIALNAWILFFVAAANPAAALASVATLAMGLGLALLGRRGLTIAMPEDSFSVSPVSVPITQT